MRIEYNKRKVLDKIYVYDLLFKKVSGYQIDEESKNYVNINLNQISKIEINQKNIALYLDNDTIICLNI